MSMLSRFPVAALSGIQYVGGVTASIPGSTATTTDVSLTSLSGGMGSRPRTGDIIIVFYGVSSTADRTFGVTTDGYVEIAELYVNDTYDANLSVSFKFAGINADTIVTLSATGATTDAGAVAIQVFRGVSPTLPFSATATTAIGSNSVLANPPAITPTIAGSIVVAGGAGAHTAGVQTYSSSNLLNFISNGGADNTNDVVVGMGWNRGQQSVAFDPAAFTFSAASAATNSWAAATLALNPDIGQSGPFLISQASTQNTSNSTSLVINKPSGTREGDLLVAFMNAPAAITWTGDTGWTEVADQGASPATRVAYKVAGASEGASYTFTLSSTSTGSGTIVAYRNAAYDAIGTIASAANPLVVGAVTASVNYARVVSTASRGAASITITGPATMETVFIDNDATSPSRLVEQDQFCALSGSSGTRSFVVGSATAVSGVLTSIKPAATYTPYAQYVASNSATDLTGNLTVTTPTCVPGNLLLFIVGYSDSSATNITVATPAGWEAFSANSKTTTTYFPGFYVFTRIANGSEAASYTATTSASANTAGAIICLAGTNNFSLSIAQVSRSTSSTTSITAIDTNPDLYAKQNSLLIYAAVVTSNNQGVVTWTAPTGMTEIVDVNNNAPTDVSFTVAYQEALSGGPPGSKTATISAASASNYSARALIIVDAL